MIAADEKLPAVLIFNPTAGRLRQGLLERVSARLGSALDLKVLTTTRQRHATDLARGAAEDGSPLVIAFGGDGHVNEVVNGLAGTASSLAVIPGGTMNVFARSLGIPRRTQEAVEHLLSRDLSYTRLVDLGMMDSRYFTFAAGCGFDAEVARMVESHLRSKRRFGEPFFYWSAFKVLAGTGRRVRLSVNVEDVEVEAEMAVARCGGGPYAYLLGRPVRLVPEGPSPEALDLFTLKSIQVAGVASYAWRALFGGSVAARPDAAVWKNVERVSVRSEAPFARHVDGEPLDASTSAEFRAAPAALRVLA